MRPIALAAIGIVFLATAGPFRPETARAADGETDSAYGAYQRG